jgi:hypothetical protein
VGQVARDLPSAGAHPWDKLGSGMWARMKHRGGFQWWTCTTGGVALSGSAWVGSLKRRVGRHHRCPEVVVQVGEARCCGGNGQPVAW